MKKTNRCVIIGGAAITDYALARSFLCEDDDCIFCDSGLRHQTFLGVQPTLIVGDFDSFENPHADAETIVLPCEKDDTDTLFAAKEAVRRGYDTFLLLGVIGGRLDHTLANLSLLLYLDAQGKRATAVDDYSEIEVVSDRAAVVSDAYAYFSLLNLTGTAEGVTIRGAKYALENAVIPCDDPYAVSNEPLPGQTATITVQKGRLLLIKDR